MWKIVKMPIAGWLLYPPPLYSNIGFGLRSYHQKLFWRLIIWKEFIYSKVKQFWKSSCGMENWAWKIQDSSFDDECIGADRLYLLTPIGWSFLIQIIFINIYPLVDKCIQGSYHHIYHLFSIPMAKTCLLVSDDEMGNRLVFENMVWSIRPPPYDSSYGEHFLEHYHF